MRWTGTGPYVMNEYQIYCGRGDIRLHRNGIAIIVTRELSEIVLGFVHVSDRVSMIKINGRRCNLNVIQVMQQQQKIEGKN